MVGEGDLNILGAFLFICKIYFDYDLLSDLFIVVTFISDRSVV